MIGLASRCRHEAPTRGNRRTPSRRVSEALYLRDPDDNGVELYWDRPPEKWPRTADGAVEMFTRTLDLESLLAAAKSQSGN